MTGIFAEASIDDCLMDVFYGTDYHSHLGTKFAGMAVMRERLLRSIGRISNTPFKAVFEPKIEKFKGGEGAPSIKAAVGVISDGEPQPLLYGSQWGNFAIVTNGKINNLEELANELSQGGRLIQIEDVEPTEFIDKEDVPNQTDIVANLISKKATIPEGIAYMRSKINGAISLVMLVTKPEETGFWLAADEYNNNSLFLGRKKEGFAITTSTTALHNLGLEPQRKLEPGEITYLTASGLNEDARFFISDKEEPCVFLDIYAEFPPSKGPFGMAAESFRYQTGAALARRDRVLSDIYFGVADSGIGHMLGFNNEKVKVLQEFMGELLRLHKEDSSEFEDTLDKAHQAAMEISPIQRALIKYGPSWGRSYQPDMQSMRDFVGFMKQVPIPEIIYDKTIKFFEDSIVRGTQLKQMISKMREYKPRELHGRVGSPILLDSCAFNRSTKKRRELESWRGVSYLEGIPLSEDEKPSDDIELVDHKLVLEYANPDTKKNTKLVNWIREDLKLDTLMYLHPKELLAITSRQSDEICRHCFGYKSQRI
ncbi:hypothetical protein HQ533_00135 [Candidatus Woesearchaeota archaeon]|nr:hypothetical protein [Candidatus Woesearchaeota archaeon]